MLVWPGEHPRGHKVNYTVQLLSTAPQPILPSTFYLPPTTYYLLPTRQPTAYYSHLTLVRWPQPAWIGGSRRWQCRCWAGPSGGSALLADLRMPSWWRIRCLEYLPRGSTRVSCPSLTLSAFFLSLDFLADAPFLRALSPSFAVTTALRTFSPNLNTSAGSTSMPRRSANR